MNIACQYQDDSCLRFTNQKLKSFVNDDLAVEPDLEAVVYCNGMKTADEKTFSKLLQIAKSADSTQRHNLLTALGCTQNSSLLRTFLDFVIDSETFLTSAEIAHVFESPFDNGQDSILVLINFVRDNAEIIKNQVSNICANIASQVSSDVLLNEFDSLLDFLRSVEIISETDLERFKFSAKEIIEWQKLNLRNIQTFFEELEKTTTIRTSTEIILSTTDNSFTTQASTSYAASTSVLLVSFGMKFLF